jgi:hypothetical protein
LKNLISYPCFRTKENIYTGNNLKQRHINLSRTLWQKTLLEKLADDLHWAEQTPKTSQLATKNGGRLPKIMKARDRK